MLGQWVRTIWLRPVKFDRVLQSMAEGDFHSAAALDTLPVSSLVLSEYY